MLTKLSKLDIKFLPLLLLPFATIVGQAAISIVLFFSILIFFFKFKKIKINLDLQNILLIIFFFVLILSTIINFDLEKKNYRFLFSSFLYLKFLIIYFLISSINFKDNTYFTIKNIFLLTFFCLIFVLLDTLYQYYNPENVDFFGYMATGQNSNRLTGPFGNNEAIAGSYLIKICFLSLVFVNFLIIFSNILYKNFFLIFIFLLNIFFFITILLSGERIAFLMSLLSLSILIVFVKRYKKIFVVFGLSIFIIFGLIISNNEYIKSRYEILGKFILSKNL